MPLVSKAFGDIITFSRSSGATWFNSAGILQGVDFSVTSNTIGTGSKTFTLDATAGVNRYWTAGDTVLISDQANSANNMVGTVTSYNASTQVLVCDITSTGGSGTLTAWRIGSTMPRFDYDPSTLAAQGLLIEEARTNLYTYSQQIQNAIGFWAVVRGSTIANAINGLDGTLSASKLQEDTSTANSHYVYTAGQSYTAGITYTQSVYVKAAGRTQIQMSFPSGAFTTELRILYDLTAVTAVVQSGAPTGTIVSVGNGWYRCTITATATTTASANTVMVYLFNGTISYTGDGSSGVYLWGAQLEAGAFPTSYIPTTTTSLTRNADEASVNTLSPWFNSAAGTLFAQGILVGGTAATFPRMTTLAGSNPNNDDMGIVWGANTGSMRWTVRAGGSAQADITFSLPKSAGASFKVAGRYAVNDFQAAFDGNLGTPDTTGSLPTITSLLLGGPASFQPGANVWLQRVTFYPRGLSNAELQALTV